MLATLMDIVFLFAVLPECRSCPCFSAALFYSYHRKIISHSDGHSVVNRQNKKPIHRDIKNRRERCSRFKMMFYVTALKFKDGTVCSSVHSLTVPKSIEVQTAVFSLSIPQALGGLRRILNRNILYLVVVLFHKGIYYIKTITENQVFGKILYSFCKSRAYYFVILTAEHSVIGKYMLIFFETHCNYSDTVIY